ncbi:uncharacterized protein BCR38DRAFT_484908 [Pseudomassariella vexata]|uniref:Uncharacterized protein n=1 Tax=Pseudomassariella vexata TaxID=1141098 RepID=A0A1Y2E1U1_9PEZI|nr:uncharacterized protein BCR38DRAFT_484908 [Pseudomassariella vexata]ORY65492.1 hypothetical protein BCR38DRAFT_484908 [Pseudomassariella vexata]
MSIYRNTQDLFLNGSESRTGVFDLPEDDAEILEKFLSYLCRDNYDDEAYPTSEEPSAATLMSLEDIMDLPVQGEEEAADKHNDSYVLRLTGTDTQTPAPISKKKLILNIQEI